MIEEQGRVVAREPGALWVETLRAGTCASCQARQGCGHSLINRRAGGQRARLRVAVADSHPYREQDTVVIGVAEQALLRGALWVYALPLLLLFAGALLGEALALSWAGRPLDGSAILGVAGLVLGFLINRFHARRVAGDSRYQPVVLRRSPTPSPRVFHREKE